MITTINYFCRTLHRRCLTGFWICPRFSVCRGSKYASRSEYARVLNIPRFWICFWFSVCQDSEYVRFTWSSKCAWIIPEYAWLYLNLPEYKCVNMTKSAWRAFVLLVSFLIPCLLERVVTISTKCIVWRKMTLFSWSDKISIFL